ncbi:ferritin-like domain-containing protein [Trametes polyzona]|nr:ferritin-like domain-containing protein [Trametes polyzona]
MFRKAILLAFAGAVATLAQSTTWDNDNVAQYLLTLKHAENALFTQGLNQFSDSDFKAAGYPTWVRNRFKQIAAHEASHVKQFTDNNSGAPAACTYDFGLTDVASFIDLAQRFTTIDASAGLGALAYIDGKGLEVNIATSAAAESRQAAWITASVQKRQPWNGAWETPLSPDGAYSLIAPYIDECPDSNPDLPFKTYPQLTVYPGSPAKDGTVFVSLTLKANAAKYYLAWLDGLTVKYTPITNGQTTVPDGLDGTVYVAVVSNQQPPSESNLISGFAVVQFPFDSWAVEAQNIPKISAGSKKN